MIFFNVKPRGAVLTLIGLAVASLAGLLLVSAIPQDQTYHQFADQRTLLGIPNFWNVVSNLPFVVIGAMGLSRYYPHAATAVLFLGILLTGLGSAYYHWDPDDGTLFWDRLPMTLCFMAILAIMIEERVDARAGGVLLWPLLALGLFSLLLWRATGDLRLYVWVQFFPAVALLALFLMFPPRWTGTSYWLVAAGFYPVAKLLEFYDGAVYSVTSLLTWISHTICWHWGGESEKVIFGQ